MSDDGGKWAFFIHFARLLALVRGQMFLVEH
jgi:hypothetical protein